MGGEEWEGTCICLSAEGNGMEEHCAVGKQECLGCESRPYECELVETQMEHHNRGVVWDTPVSA